jgi:transposase InsO family protein
VLQIVYDIRKVLPKTGTRKLHCMVNERLAAHGLQVGRDHLFELLRAYKLLIRCRRRKAVTTNSRHWMKKYSNLIQELEVHRPEQLWVSDITYIATAKGHLYLSLVTDAYSHKIMGYNLSKNLEVEGCVAALTMALQGRSGSGKPLIHHSDRGSQYCCKDYVALLREQDIAISMTTNGDPYQNAIAERVNGILKSEFNLYSSHYSFEDTSSLVRQSIEAYNELRLHSSCDYFTPEAAHKLSGPLKKRWKTYRRRPVINI